MTTPQNMEKEKLIRKIHRDAETQAWDKQMRPFFTFEQMETAYSLGEKAMLEKVKNDLDVIWNKYHVNNYEEDGHRDSPEDVINTLFAGLKEQIDYFSTLTSN